jgi:dTDP-4-dehydrorhamnose 3,5-epimerase
MLFEPLDIAGAFVVTPELIGDERGFFARSWDRRDFTDRGLNDAVAQCNISFNHSKGTLRGMHYQVPPHEESKLVRCTKGAIYDVVIDLRPDSSSFKSYAGATLSSENHQMMYVPEGCAHGFLTLEDDVEIAYQISEFYAAEAQRGVRWNDPAFGINWPERVAVINERDSSYPDFVD